MFFNAANLVLCFGQSTWIQSCRKCLLFLVTWLVVAAQAEEPQRSCDLRMLARPVSRWGCFPVLEGLNKVWTRNWVPVMNFTNSSIYSLLKAMTYAVVMISIFKNGNKHFLPGNGGMSRQQLFDFSYVYLQTWHLALLSHSGKVWGTLGWPTHFAANLKTLR